MPLLISCPECQTKYKVPDAAQGRSVTCKKCATVFKVGADAQVVGDSTSAPKVPPSVKPIAKTPAPAAHDDDDEPRAAPPRKSGSKSGGSSPDKNFSFDYGGDAGKHDVDDEEDDRPVRVRDRRKKSAAPGLIGTAKGGMIAAAVGGVLFLLTLFAYYNAASEFLENNMPAGMPKNVPMNPPLKR